jgi:drug/metabolite transporter (DMT)-like permease
MILYLFFNFLLIATSFIINKFIALSLKPYLFVFLRMGISGIILIIFFCREKKIFLYLFNNIKTIILIAFFTTFLTASLRAYALQLISPTRIAFWGTLEPFISSFCMYFLYKSKITIRQFIGIVIAIIGSIFFIFTNNKIETISSKACFFADFAQILSIFFSRYGWIRAQEIIRKNIFLPEQLNAFIFIISSIIAFFFNCFFSSGFAIKDFNLDCKLILMLFYTIIIGNIIAYSMYGYALKKYDVRVISIAGLSVPLFVHIIGVLFLSEAFSYSFFISMIFIFFGVYIFHKKK